MEKRKGNWFSHSTNYALTVASASSTFWSAGKKTKMKKSPSSLKKGRYNSK